MSHRKLPSGFGCKNARLLKGVTRRPQLTSNNFSRSGSTGPTNCCSTASPMNWSRLAHCSPCTRAAPPTASHVQRTTSIRPPHRTAPSNHGIRRTKPTDWFNRRTWLPLILLCYAVTQCTQPACRPPTLSSTREVLANCLFLCAAHECEACCWLLNAHPSSFSTREQQEHHLL